MKKTDWFCLLLSLIAVFLLGLPSVSRALAKEGSDWFLSRVNIPDNLTPSGGRKIVVAIVDDGVRTTHTSLREFIWQNPFEIPGNFIDDDGNGQVDDTNGWDVADNNRSVSPPQERLQEYYHGTHLAGIIAQVARAAFGARAVESIAIMPVKILSDNAPDTAIRNGYKGIEYAVQAGADIILCAWSVARISAVEEKILHRAREKGVLIIASAGNVPEGQDQYPAADNSVFAIAALDKDNIISNRSNYGTFVDLSAPGVDIVSASTISDKALDAHEGTSQAAAIVAGAAAVIMSQSPSSSNEQIKACLKGGSSLLASESSEYAAKLGAGRLNIKASVAWLHSEPLLPTTLFHPQGHLKLSDAKAETTTWVLEPAGNFKGIWFTRPEQQEETGQAIIDFYTGSIANGKPLASFSFAAMPDRFFVPGTKAMVTVRTETDMQHMKNLLLEYRAESINFRTLYCQGTSYLTEPGSFDDGSGNNLYSGSSDCKWLITAPKDKVIHFKFSEFDTEPRKDFLYFFNGTGTHEKIMAIFSGQKTPPELTTWQNKVLVWFVTNSDNQRQGWKGDFVFIDKEKAKYPTKSHTAM